MLDARLDAIDVELVASGNGAFEVHRDGKLVFSKLQSGRFPDDEEIVQALTS